MKNYFITPALALIIFCFLSCSKAATDANYFKVKMDDKWVTYTEAQFFLHPDPVNPSQTDLQVYAGNYLSNINISMQNTAGITTGEYTTTNSSYRLVINLFKNNGSYIQTFGSTTSATGSQPSYVLNITSFNESEIRGTITGNYLYDNLDATAVNITNGEFVARRVDY